MDNGRYLISTPPAGGFHFKRCYYHNNNNHNNMTTTTWPWTSHASSEPTDLRENLELEVSGSTSWRNIFQTDINIFTIFIMWTYLSIQYPVLRFELMISWTQVSSITTRPTVLLLLCTIIGNDLAFYSFTKMFCNIDSVNVTQNTNQSQKE